MNEQGTIFNIQRFCIHDGPGIRTTVFLKGCPLSCVWCHNPESKRPQPQLSFQERACTHCGSCQSVCPQAVHQVTQQTHQINFAACRNCGRCIAACPSKVLVQIGRHETVHDIIAEVLKDADYYQTSGGGLTLSGGEPLMQPAFTLALLQAAKTQGLHTCLETCGFCSEEVLQRMLPFVDLFLFDFKLHDDTLHQKYTGVSVSPILHNLMLLEKTGANVVLRCPIIPTVNDIAAHFQEIARLSHLTCVQMVELMPYHTMGREKSKQIGVSYVLNSDAAQQGSIQQWHETLHQLGCEKLAPPL